MVPSSRHGLGRPLGLPLRRLQYTQGADVRAVRQARQVDFRPAHRRDHRDRRVHLRHCACRARPHHGLRVDRGNGVRRHVLPLPRCGVSLDVAPVAQIPDDGHASGLRAHRSVRWRAHCLRLRRQQPHLERVADRGDSVSAPARRRHCAGVHRLGIRARNRSLDLTKSARRPRAVRRSAPPLPPLTARWEVCRRSCRPLARWGVHALALG
mmetsp:Transcript_120963/g.336838  ORF Transcript_120963/g.336838 Transcript_120963/m.336838 type:complete len:210 (-) Transcript_120963:109-738(-)